MTIKASLDPQNLILSSWSPNATDPCNASFEGIACNEHGQVVNISLQEKGFLIGQLKSLSGLYLHFNKLHGFVPKELSNLTELTDLYLNVNNLSGDIPPEIGDMSNLQVLQLCYNRLTGNIPTQLGSLKKLNVLALQSNQLSGAIPANLGEMEMLTSKKIGNAFDSGDSRLSTDQTKEVCRRSSSPLMSLEYSNGWDPLAKRNDINSFSQEVLESYMFNLDEVESATQYFSETNLLGKSSFSAIYKGILRDGSIVAIKCISKISCKTDETEFLKGLKLLTSLKHENLLRLRGFCCSKDRGECFLIYDFVPNGNLLQCFDVKEGKRKVLDWPARKSIIRGIAKGIEYLHGNKNGKPTLVHRNISAEKILIDQNYNPLLSDSGLHKLLADDIVFSTLKGSAAMGYLAPEYTTTGRFTEKSDVYAFGMIIFQILSGKSRITQLNCHGAEISRFEDFIDVNLDGKFKESEAARLGEVALLCTHESPNQRPDIGTVMQELDDIISNSCLNS
ncbi:hypothetical protein DH2020_023248 [Rehmannia glutinosa]|uniref:Protein kinase domain-containing protein n=1 Tax=Rehmannia glutinosa TaxID=99300 RepID=A0ABR0W9M8_REHGL